MRGEVVDQGGGLEHEVRRRGVGDVGGQGLELVASVAEQWGVHEGTSHVWFEVAPDTAEADAVEPQLGERERPAELE